MQMTPVLSEKEILRAEKEACRRSLARFVKEAWHVIEPVQPYVHGWHIDAMCKHLQAVTDGQITRLLINIPPGTMKSLLVSVFWPMWEWGPRGLSHHRTIGASYNGALSERDNMRARRLCFSRWYQQRWPIGLMLDQDTKKKFENTNTGWRIALPSNGMTGERGDRVVIDDPHSVDGAFSQAEREGTLRWFTETVPTRLNNPKTSAIVVVMQRLHQRDVSGLIIEDKLGYEQLILPMRFEADRRCRTKLPFKDPRKEEGELLFAERFPIEVVERDEKILGAAAPGQFQQRPAPRGGMMIEVGKITIAPPPSNFIRRVRYWDKAGTEGGGKRTAGVLMGFTDKKTWFILDVVKGQWGAANREERIKQTAILDGRLVKIWVEQEPGSGGKESAEATIKMLAGFNVEAERPTGDKALRAEPFASQVKAGNIFISADMDPVTAKELLTEFELFPVGRFKDQVDATSGAFNKLTGSSDLHRLMMMAGGTA